MPTLLTHNGVGQLANKDAVDKIHPYAFLTIRCGRRTCNIQLVMSKIQYVIWLVIKKRYPGSQMLKRWQVSSIIKQFTKLYENVQVYLVCFSRFNMLKLHLQPKDGAIALSHQSAFPTFNLAFGVLICRLLSRIIKCLQNSCFHPLKNLKSKIFNNV